jgi:methylthioribose-1-phosphate isomerase
MLIPVRYRHGTLELIDQTLLPGQLRWLSLRTVDALAEAIRSLRIRGAPAIGIAAAYGLVLAAEHSAPSERMGPVRRAADALRATRPTAVNLAWALDRQLRVAERLGTGRDDELPVALLREARTIHARDIRGNRRIAAFGAALLPRDAIVLTHCNTGSLATGGYGTALGIVRTAWRRGRLHEVFVDETRPLLQGSRLTAWELTQERIPYRLLVDSAAGSLLARGSIDAVLVGADRIARNGDVANKIGSYPLAVLAREHGVPYYSVAPTSTIDPETPSGQGIPIEQRDPEELRTLRGVAIAPEDAAAANPAFDVVPHELITGIVTEHGVLHPPFGEAIERVFA